MSDQAPPPPQWAPPPQQPQWGAPPPGAWGAPAYAPPPSRPIGVTLSAAWYIFIGVLLVIVGIIAVVAFTALEGLFQGSEIPGGAAAGIGIFIAVIVGLFALLFLGTGIGLLRGRGWARIVGIVLAVLGLLGGISTLTTGGNSGGLIYGIIVTAIYAGIIFALYTAGSWFAAMRR